MSLCLIKAMKHLPNLILIFIITSCSSGYVPNTNETKKIYNEATKLLNRNKGIINKNKWPAIFTKINASSVIAQKHGLYIQTNSSFVEETGLFIPTKSFKVKTGTEYDPSYTEISNGVYKYRIKG